MPTAQLAICFDSEWLIAGGESTLGTADMAPTCDPEGLPTILGRALRGLLREAVTLIDDCNTTNHADRLFGTRKSAKVNSVEGDGTIRIGNALVIEAIAAQCTDNDKRADLFATIRRTALEQGTRTVKAGSLREMEVAIAGIELVAELHCESNSDLELIAFASGLIRSLGHSRSRGLGRCRFEVWCDNRHINPTELPAALTKGVMQ